MIELDQSNLGGCQGQHWLTETAGRTVVAQDESRILPVDHLVNTVTHVHKRLEGPLVVRNPYIRVRKVRWADRSSGDADK